MILLLSSLLKVFVYLFTFYTNCELGYRFYIFLSFLYDFILNI